MAISGVALADEVLKYSHQGVERTAALHQPASASGHSAPLIIAVHGLGDTGSNFEKWVGFDAVADREGFVVAYPDAIGGSWSYGRPIIEPMPKVGDQTVDDVGFMRLLIDDLVARKIANPGKVYVTGVSRGGLLTYTMACLFADRIAAVATVITGMTDHQIEDCHRRPIPIMLIAGSADISQVYDGWIYNAGRQMSVVETLEYWRIVDGCTGQEGGKFLPHLNPDDPTRVGIIVWTGCKNKAEVRFYKVVAGGHQVPMLVGAANPMREERFGLRNRDIESAQEIWSFLKRFSLTAD
jgi:polyhydroxybutyrate depolymerase